MVQYKSHDGVLKNVTFKLHNIIKIRGKEIGIVRVKKFNEMGYV